MSGLANKVKETLSSDKHNDSSAPEGTYGTHNSRAANTADPRFDSDMDNRAAPGTTTGTSGFNSTTGTTGSSGLHSTTGQTGATGTFGLHSSAGGPAPKTDGPHKSDMMNKGDPRVDSDRDYSKNMGVNSDRSADPSKGPSAPGAYRDENMGTSGLHSTTGTHGAHGTTAGHTGMGSGNIPGTTTTSSGAREGTYGTHNSRAANAADPRIDSDMDGSRNVGGNRTGGLGNTTGTTGTTGTHGITAGHSGMGSENIPRTTTTHSGAREGTYGTHNSRAANAADPRIDSDMDGSRNVGGNSTGGLGNTTGTTGTTGHHNTTGTTGTTGHHSTGTHGTTGTEHSSGLGSTGPSSKTTGPAPNTAGPHKSDMLNKLDPRVDSNLDGSKTVGGDKTHAADRTV